jgi:hypothetical protein
MTIVEYLNKQKKSFKKYGIGDRDFEMVYPNTDLNEFIYLHGSKSTKKYKPEIMYNNTLIMFRKK